MTEKFIFNSEVLNVQCSYGLSLLEPISATGKSYASELMSEIDDGSMFIIIKSKKDYEAFFNTIDSIKQGTLLFLDRCDLFMSDKILEYIKTRTDIVILADIKDPSKTVPLFGLVPIIVVDSDEVGKVVITDDLNYGRQWRSKHLYSYI